MIQFNLLPDVKLQYIKAKSTKRMVTSIAILTTITALVIMILLFFVVDVLQKKHLSDLNKDIAKYSSQLNSTKDLNKILTIQNQLNNLTALHDKKPVVSRLPGYLSQITPANVGISNLSIDFAQFSIRFTGTADNLSSVNTFVDTLKFTTFDTDNTKGTNAFKNVVLSSFTPGKDGKTSFDVTLGYDPTIFDSAAKVKLTVPSKTTTRSEVEKPQALFQTKTDTTGGN